MLTSLMLTSSLTNNIIWKNETPNSSKATCPLAIITEKESQNLLEFINKSFKPVEAEVQKNGVQFNHCGVRYDAQVVVHRSMKDFKIRQMETGLFGAHCLCSFSKPNEWKDIQKIESSFSIERTAKSILEIYERMLNEYNEIKK